ncbi:MAG: hypothetical protein ACXVPN_11235 [Bacteroidia bacterium]
MKNRVSLWIRLSLVNLFIVALLGVLMRYKIGFEFPYFSQKNIQHAHSHFAFAGWITHCLYLLIVNFLFNKLPGFNYVPYRSLLAVNLICAYGMLISFFAEGYGTVSIFFSMLSVFVACFFSFSIFREFRKMNEWHPSIAWFRAALWFAMISSIGTFYLAYIMASHHFNEHWYLASVYFYLHFQYNGFFIFACMGLAINEAMLLLPNYKYNPLIFKLSVASAVPAYFLSTLWANLPVWLYIIVIIAAIAQVVAWILFLLDIRKAYKVNHTLTPFARYIFMFVAAAFSIKLLLQLGSTIPVVSKLAFGFRPVVIAYLHLVLLAVISVFILAHFYTLNFIRINRFTVAALFTFTIGVFLNELALAVQGVASFGYLPINYINETLFGISILLLGGALLLVISQFRKSTLT